MNEDANRAGDDADDENDDDDDDVPDLVENFDEASKGEGIVQGDGGENRDFAIRRVLKSRRGGVRPSKRIPVGS